ncbi:hypothetical protein M2459_003124 [Parabacteroides sp. PF5-5]|uniref:Mfa1 family fimbria major subunit n=1 Tax=unclassified Parabacteroides TaxID=2649774 RepID=UPI002473058F|nr:MULTISPECIES: Mfa1 family fimbria major subunit [unclassified Parabacteroides]MDH6307067.1 hypothetical protein [Parabacteroides sp. PH5-39]MDH6317273.1 hypothetical protein [Parabacteroides sp. PF5-13]MDH6321723.1 hypothetical protein [Parabacteroides sp. PH5-13]MDH6325455.1 hypothetical protein [Parabacteroides sp. PH5-8]MDH6328553.1 hypothetical protein [Parabacteroides sp. PH5-41]
MKKTFKFFMTAVTAVALMASCSSEEVAPIPEGPGGDKGEVVEGEPTYATFSFNVQNNVKTKASSITDASETDAINDIRLLIFRTGNSSTCEVNEVYSNPSAPDTDKTKTVLLSSGTKKVFVIVNAEGLGTANPFDKAKIIPNTTTLAQFYKASEIDLGTTTAGKVTAVDITKLVDTSAGYIMSNPADANSQYVLVGGISESDSRTAAPGTENMNHFKIEVLRTVAKAKIYYNEDKTLETTDGVGKITASSLKYGIKNINRSVNLFQLFSGDMVAAGSTPWAPYYTQTESWSAADKEDLSKYAPFYHREYLMKHTVTKKGTAADNAPSIYFTENTSQIQRRGNSTYAAIEAIFAPKAGKYVPKDGIKYNATSGVATITPSTADVAASGQTLYMLLEANGTTGLADGMLFVDVKDAKLAAYAAQYDHTGTATWDGTYANIPVTFNPFETTGSGNTGTPLSTVKTYADGKCYYRLNFGIGDMLTNSMDYGVWRNYHYQANITQFGGIGDNLPEELDIDPEIPLGERTHVTATIIVKDWTDGNSTIIL